MTQDQLCDKALADGETVRVIHWQTAWEDLNAILEEAK